MSASMCPRSESPRFSRRLEPVEGAGARFQDSRAEPATPKQLAALARVGGGLRPLSKPRETLDRLGHCGRRRPVLQLKSV